MASNDSLISKINTSFCVLLMICSFQAYGTMVANDYPIQGVKYSDEDFVLEPTHLYHGSPEIVTVIFRWKKAMPTGSLQWNLVDDSLLAYQDDKTSGGEIIERKVAPGNKSSAYLITERNDHGTTYTLIRAIVNHRTVKKIRPDERMPFGWTNQINMNSSDTFNLDFKLPDYDFTEFELELHDLHFKFDDPTQADRVFEKIIINGYIERPIKRLPLRIR